jgi:hypothetical protein
MSWSERKIAGYLARHTFQRKHLVVPNCNWTGNECDLLVVTPDLRIIDVEIKISRADLKADAGKEKWWHPRPWRRHGEPEPARRPRDWPPRVWKHFYCLPAKIWTADLLAALPAVSGILLIRDIDTGGPNPPFYILCERRSKPNRDATKIDAGDAIDIARLAGLRMWDAFEELERVRNDCRGEKLLEVA